MLSEPKRNGVSPRQACAPDWCRGTGKRSVDTSGSRRGPRQSHRAGASPPPIHCRLRPRAGRRARECSRPRGTRLGSRGGTDSGFSRCFDHDSSSVPPHRKLHADARPDHRPAVGADWSRSRGPADGRGMQRRFHSTLPLGSRWRAARAWSTRGSIAARSLTTNSQSSCFPALSSG